MSLQNIIIIFIFVIFNKNFIYFLLNFKKNIYYVIHHFTKIYLHIWKNNQSKCK